MEKNTIAYLLTSESVIRDEYTKKPSYMGIFEILNIPKGENKLLIAFAVVGKICSVDAGKIKIKIKILNPSSNLLKDVELTGTVVEGDLDIQAFFPFTEFTEKGRHLIKISMNDIDLKDDNRFYFDVK